ncbi:MAG: hypothetical protein KBF93_05605 [Leptospiraceae bacterium]|nr:hypothetical protein [Leptospiraceae bacterium]
MKKVILFFVILVCFISNQPISITDKEFVIFYFCDMKGRYEFDLDGRMGLATISELKRQESKRFYDHRGQVFLLSGGNFSGVGDNMRSHFGLLNKAAFDAVFVGEEELLYLEQNLALRNLELPLIAERENEFKAIKEKHITSHGIHFRISSNLPSIEDKSVDIQLLFHTTGSYDYLKSLETEKPIYYFLNESEISSFSFKKNIYTAQCPSPEKIGKLSLFFRKKNLIRQRQEFIPLNSKDSNNSWLEPDREIINELK